MIVPYRQAYLRQVVELWQRCDLTVPWNNPYQDIERKVCHSPDKFLIGVVDDSVIASVMYDYDGHRGTVYYLAVEPKLQGRGFGKQLMAEVESRLRKEGCAKLNLMVRTSNSRVLAFYQRLGYVEDKVVNLGKRLSPPDKPYE